MTTLACDIAIAVMNDPGNPEKGGDCVSQIEEIILDNIGALNPPKFRGTKEWFLALSSDLRPNQVFELAENRGLPEYVCMGLKILQAHRDTPEFERIVLG